MLEHKEFMRRAIELARLSVENNGGGPFGAVVVKNGIVIGEGMNSVTNENDPTAHAEIQAIRNACKNLDSFQLDDCIIYSSCEPCPMCLGAIYWARPKAVFFGASKLDAAAVDFDDSFIYDEMEKDYGERRFPMEQLCEEEARQVFTLWELKDNKTKY